MAERTTVLFLCTGNSARSQMGEGFLRSLGGHQFDVFSAGTEIAERVNPLAVKAMAEAGIDISGQTPKDLGVFDGRQFDLLITVCDQARAACPIYLGADQTVHWSLQDPAAAAGNDEERMGVFRAIRDEIRRRVQHLIEAREAVNDDGPPAVV